MELISDKELKNLPVIGKSGAAIGRVVGYELDVDAQNIVNYIVKAKQSVKGIFKNSLIISRDQVIEVNKTRMLIDDSASSTATPGSQLAAEAN